MKEFNRIIDQNKIKINETMRSQETMNARINYLDDMHQKAEEIQSELAQNMGKLDGAAIL